MADLVAFLTARYDRIEKLAKAAAERAGGEHWYATKDGGFERYGSVAFVVDGYGNLDPHAGNYVAQHDPAYVLADIAAKRKILALHEMGSGPERWGDVRWSRPDMTPAERKAEYGKLVGSTVYWCSICDNHPDYGHIERAKPGCETLLALAAPFAGHSDYDPSWRIDA